MSKDAVTVDQAITVNAVDVTSIEVATMPTKTTYHQGDTLDTTGLVVNGHHAGGTVDVTSGCTFSPTVLNTIGTQTITVTHTDSGETTSFDVTVTAAPAIAMYHRIDDVANLTAGSKVLIAGLGDETGVMGNKHGSSDDYFDVVTGTKIDTNTKIQGLPDGSCAYPSSFAYHRMTSSTVSACWR